MLSVSCREVGVDCGFVGKGESEKRTNGQPGRPCNQRSWIHTGGCSQTRDAGKNQGPYP